LLKKPIYLILFKKAQVLERAHLNVKYQVFTAIKAKICLLDATPCILAETEQRF
jgi:hypothetical protein